MPKITNNDISQILQQQVKEAIASKEPLYIHGGNSKLFYGNKVDAKPLDISQHSGVVSYEPTELCITVQAGTRLRDIVDLLAEHQQILPFEPPMYSENTTIGGAIATGISGPRRAYTGSVRDAILGVQMINGDGDIVNFGGQVMKNVAGYDLSRLMVRSQGTLGVILNVSLRLLPKPTHDVTVGFETSASEAIEYFQNLRTQQLPITATAWFDGQAFIRLSASEATTISSQKRMGLAQANTSKTFWQDIRDHKHEFFKAFDKPLWRLSLPTAAGNIANSDDKQLIEWGGAQRWLSSNAPSNIIQGMIGKHDAHATLFASTVPDTQIFPELDPLLLKIHKQLKNKMDPHGIFNPNRIYQGL
ncbi:MAG: glycolate oxidase subunit GlcE [Cocleimonas sp.]